MRMTTNESWRAVTLLLCAVTLLAALPEAAPAITIHVPGQQPTIAAGIAAASPATRWRSCATTTTRQTSSSRAP